MQNSRLLQAAADQRSALYAPTIKPQAVFKTNLNKLDVGKLAPLAHRLISPPSFFLGSCPEIESCSLVWFLDIQLGTSASAYCLFYTTWNTQLNELRPGWQSATVGAGYGTITMSVASGYLIIRAAIVDAVNHKAR